MARRSNKVKARPQPTLEGMAYEGATPLPNVKHELFCKLYASNTTPSFFGNGKRCYIFAFGRQQEYDDLQADLIGADTRTGRGKKKKLNEHDRVKRKIESLERSCASQASTLLTNPNILARCTRLMDELIEDKVVDRELAFVIQQRDDLSIKVQAIIHYDKKRGRLQEKQETTIKFEPITGVEFVMPDAPAN